MYRFFRPIIFKLEAETAHRLAINFLKINQFFPCAREYQNLATRVAGIDFKNPIGLAAGFDKNAEIIPALTKFGFGFIECGSVTPKPQTGNPRPRIFRLAADQALVNSLGFNNLGAEVFQSNLARKTEGSVVGINLGKNKSSAGFDDYLALFTKFHSHATYLTINISSPNTPGLRDLQQSTQLSALIQAILKQRSVLAAKVPILVKLAPDLTWSEQQQIAEVLLTNRVDGIIIGNTSNELAGQSGFSQGGLSGKPLLPKSNQMLRNFYWLTEGRIPLIGVGGISSATDVYQKIKLGASLVQIYSAFIYQGFGLVERIKLELSEMVARDGFKSISEVVGRGSRDGF